MDLSNQETAQKVIKQCLDGDREAQQAFYKHFYSLALGICMRYASDVNEAKDMMHDGFIKVFVNMSGFKFKGSLEGWVKRILVNNALDTIRNNKRFIATEIEEVFGQEEPNDPFGISDEEIIQADARLIVELIQQLPRMARVVVNLIVFEGYSHQQVADELGISVSSSKSTYSRARQKIRTLFYENRMNNE